MSLFETLMSQPLVYSIGWALVHSLWQGSLVALIAAAVLAIIGRERPNLRYGVALVGLVLMLLLPLLTVVSQHPAASPASSSPPPSVARAEPSWGLDQLAAAPGEPAALATGSGPGVERLLPWLSALWLLGVAGLSFYNLIGWRQALRLSHTGSQRLGHFWQACRKRLCQQLGIRRPVRLLSSARVEVPIVVGWLRPVVLVPMSALSGLSPDQIDALLAHELAHVRRHDYLVNLLQTALETLLFYHPAVWWLSQQVRIEREHCCDDIAVQSCGNRAVYVRALADMEGLRVSSHALAATGGSLLNRVRRLLGRAPHRSFNAGVWLTSAVQALLLLTAATLIGLSPVSAALPASASSSEPMLEELVANVEGELSGTWESTRSNGQVRLQVTAEGDHWHSQLTFAESDFTGLDSTAPELRRDAGTIHLTGAIPAEGPGSGRFTFTANPEYQQELSRLGLGEISTERAFPLMVHDLSLELIHGLRELGYDDADLEELLACRIHEVTPEYAEEMRRAGFGELELEQLLAYRIHEITPEYAEEMRRAGFGELKPEQLLAYRIHEITPEYAEEMRRAGFGELDPDQLLAYRIHEITPEYAEELRRAGLGELDPEQLLACRIHEVTARFAEELSEAGVTDLSLENLLAYRIHDVSRSFIDELAELGYQGLSSKILLQMRIHDVTPDFIRETNADGGHRSAEELIEMRVLGR